MWVKIHTSAGSRKIIAICDKDLLGKKVEEGRLQLDINEHFYKGEKKTKKEIVPLLKGSFILNLTGENVITSDVNLFIASIGGHKDWFQAVHNGSVDVCRIVGGCNKHHLGKIERVINEVIQKAVVLGGVEELDKDTHDIHAGFLCDPVDFVEENDGVFDPGVAKGADDVAWFGLDMEAGLAAKITGGP